MGTQADGADGQTASLKMSLTYTLTLSCPLICTGVIVVQVPATWSLLHSGLFALWVKDRGCEPGLHKSGQHVTSFWSTVILESVAEGLGEKRATRLFAKCQVFVHVKPNVCVWQSGHTLLQRAPVTWGVLMGLTLPCCLWGTVSNSWHAFWGECFAGRLDIVGMWLMDVGLVPVSQKRFISRDRSFGKWLLLW